MWEGSHGAGLWRPGLSGQQEPMTQKVYVYLCFENVTVKALTY